MATKQRIGWTFLLLLVGLAPIGIAFQNWERVTPASIRDLSAALLHPADSEKTLLASRDQIYEARSGSKDWKKITPAQSGIQILRLHHFSEFPEIVFVLADRGLFQFDLKDPSLWKRLRQNRYGETFTSFALSPQEPGRWFLGSSLHLYESQDAGKTWKISSALSEDPVCFLKFVGDNLYAASDKTLYRSDDLSYFQKTLSLSQDQEAVEDFFIETPEEETAAISCPFYDILSSASSFLWTATQRGVFESKDGETWKALPQSGLTSLSIRHLAYAPQTQQLFAGTSEGIHLFQANESRWKKLYQTAGGEEIKGLLIDEAQNKLYGITNQGFVSLPLLPDNISLPTELNSEKKLLFQELLRSEPTAREIHQAVIRYANTRNAKINRWHAESRLRAFFPTLSFGKDLSRGNNIDLDRGSTNEKDLFIEGPEDISKGWDVRVAWDLGDFVFSSSQTSIDSREKTMVDLRHTMTQEATRLYYERRRVQMEITFLPALSEEEHFERLSRMDELTALLDAMTKGWMSERLEKIYLETPRLHALWEFKDPAALETTNREI